MLKIYNMKKLLLLVSLVTLSVNAQSDEVYDKIGQETCSCLESKNIDLKNNLDGEKLTMMLGLCMIESYNKHKMELPEKERAALDDNDGMKLLGEKVAMKMVDKCPDFIIAIGQLPDDEEDAAAATEIKIEGKVTAIETKQFVTIKLKDKNGRTHSLLLLDYFDTASLFTEGKIKSGTELLVGYSDVELYDPEAKDFKYFKVITSFEKK